MPTNTTNLRKRRMDHSEPGGARVWAVGGTLEIVARGRRLVAFEANDLPVIQEFAGIPQPMNPRRSSSTNARSVRPSGGSVPCCSNVSRCCCSGRYSAVFSGFWRTYLGPARARAHTAASTSWPSRPARREGASRRPRPKPGAILHQEEGPAKAGAAQSLNEAQEAVELVDDVEDTPVQAL